jgi:outer membrane protein OmpA-like peptidoglycan-associated protein
MPKWLFPVLLVTLVAVSADVATAQTDPADCPTCKDPTVFTRMPGFHIYNSQELDFNRFEFPVSSGRAESVEGAYHEITYYANEGATLPSGLQITRNYVNAAQAAGGQKVYEFEDGGIQYVTVKVVTNGTEVWAHVVGGSNGMYTVTVVAKDAMNQDVVADAASLAGSIAETGRAAVYGILFDTDKSTIKSESALAIAEIVKLLRGNPSLTLFVVGHTDATGAFDHNIELSRARAAAVVDALVQGGITASRLTPYGVGPTAPVAPNKDEAGRAKNRRVELVDSGIPRTRD